MKETADRLKNEAITRISREFGITNLSSRLTEIPQKDLQTLLLDVFARNVEEISPSDVVRRYDDRYRFLGGGDLDQRELINFDSLFYSVVPKQYNGIEFSPTGPLGTNATLTRLSQDVVPSTIRNSEVVSDPTVMLGLEAARIRKPRLLEDPNDSEKINLCTSSRVLRLQPFDPELGYMQHFRVLAIATAGHNDNFNKFLSETSTEHISIFLDFIDKINNNGFNINNIAVYLSNIKIIENVTSSLNIDTETIRRNTQTPGFEPFGTYDIDLPETLEPGSDIREDLLETYNIKRSWNFLRRTGETIVRPLVEKYPFVNFGFDIARHAGIGYYPNFCFHIYGTNKDGLTLQLADGGLTDWTKILLNNKKELFMASGFGSELTNKMFRK